jgi:hypothetical protein
MQNRKDDNNSWLLVVAIIIIILIAIAFSSENPAKFDEREAEIKRRNEEEKKLAEELQNLESKIEIYVKHEAINAFTEKYMNDLCEKRYHQLIQVLIVLLLILNGLVIWLVPSIKVLDLFKWNGIALGSLNLAAVFFFISVKKGKEYLKGIAMNYIEFRVYENRDKTYFKQKVKFYNEEIAKLQAEIEAKKDAILKLKEIDVKPTNHLEN